MARSDVASLALVIAALAAGCDGDEGESRTDPSAGLDMELIAKVAPPAPGIVYVDLAEARSQAGLPPDADVALLDGASPEELTIFNDSGPALAFATAPASEIEGAIDVGQISAAAGSPLSAATSVAAIRTEQPFEEIVRKLEPKGYVLRDGVLATESSDLTFPDYGAIADAGDGLIVLAASEEALTKALDRNEPAAESAAALLDTVHGAMRSGYLPGSSGSLHSKSTCVRSVAIGQDIDPPEGEVVFDIDGDPDPERLDVAGDPPIVEAAEPIVEGSAVRVPLSYDTDVSAVNYGPINAIGGDLAPHERYDC